MKGKHGCGGRQGVSLSSSPKLENAGINAHDGLLWAYEDELALIQQTKPESRANAHMLFEYAGDQEGHWTPQRSSKCSLIKERGYDCPHWIGISYRGFLTTAAATEHMWRMPSMPTRWTFTLEEHSRAWGNIWAGRTQNSRVVQRECSRIWRSVE